jgi:6-pyruvoyltetrahydropterin/6-carboxytetrahydropterin synthase
MSQRSHRVHIKKEALKFAAAHMTVFPDGSKEALHGHNYIADIALDLKDTSFQQMVSFSEFKKAIREICTSWDEKVLLPQECPYFEIKSQSDAEIEFLLCKKRYVIPAEEVVLLPLDNITTESLSREFSDRLRVKLEPWIRSGLITSLEVRIDESPGQGATFYWAASSKV